MNVPAGGAAAQPLLKRQIELGMRGLDVKACKRAAARAGFPKGSLTGLTAVFTEVDVANVKSFQRACSLDDDGVIGPDTFAALLPHMDALALDLYDRFVVPEAPAVAPSPPPAAPAGSVPSSVVYPHPSTFHGPAPDASDLHQTGGLADNWALDFMAPGGTMVLAPESGTIVRLSGHDPRGGVTGGDIFGWNVYLQTPAGVLYFATHLGDRTVEVGREVETGELVGHVGQWPGDPARSHTHLGVTHPSGAQAAKEYICRIAAATRLPGPRPT